MKNIIFIAPPAAGKGTQSDLLQKHFGYLHISAGDMLRQEVAKGTPFGKNIQELINQGILVSNEIIIELIKRKIEEIGDKPFILDGFPRTLIQAEALNKMLIEQGCTDYIAIYLALNEEAAMQRMLGRLTCNCGKSYSIINFKCLYKLKLFFPASVL